MRITMVGDTDIGRRRKNNQDCIFYDTHSRFGIVADGIGGRNGGEIASSLAVNTLRKAFSATESIRHEEVAPFLISNIDRANQAIIDKGNSDYDVYGMGTTLNCVTVVGDRLYLAHIGDSRTYLWYKNNIFQLTLDHCVANFKARGWLPDPQKRVNTVADRINDQALTRALGLGKDIEVDLLEFKLQPGQIFITCSDGLSSMVKDSVICDLVNKHKNNFEKLPSTLINAANAAGGKDNITVLLSRVI